MDSQTGRVYEFDSFRLDPVKRLLLRGGRVVPLTPKVFDTLLVLIEKHGQTIGKEELIKALWPDSFVEESSLAQNIFQLRKALGGNDRPECSYVETIPKRGYRFVATVREIPSESVDLLIKKHSETTFIIEEEEVEQVEDTDLHKLIPPADQDHRGWRLKPMTLIVTVLSISLILTLYYSWNLRGTKPSPKAGGTRSIAVLPFKPLIAENNDEQLRLGMTDALVTKLSNLHQIAVRPTSSVLRYSSLGQESLMAGRELGVDAVLVGTIQQSGDQIRVTVQLLRVADGTSLWAEKFDGKFTNIFVIQDSISEQVAHALVLKLSQDERNNLTKRYTDNTEAYQAYIKGRYFWNKRSVEGLRKGIEYFQHAIEIDPTYALAYAGLADSYNLLTFYSRMPPVDSFPKARVAALRALEIDDTLAEAHTSLAYVKMLYDWDWSGAEREFKRALELNPNYPTAHHWYSEYLRLMGRYEESIAEGKRALELDPLSVVISSDLGRVYFMAGQNDRAIEQLRKALEIDAGFALAHMFLARAYLEKGMSKEAIAEVKSATQLSDGKSATVVLGYIYSRIGRKEETRRILGEIKEAAKHDYVPPYTIAMLYADIGEKDSAFEWLEKAYQERSDSLVALKTDPRFDSLRSDPRFDDLLRRVGFPS